MNKRVIAIRNTDTDNKIVYIYGYGMHVGSVQNEELGFSNPKIELDNGKVIWGYQCWWGDEKAVLDTFKEFEFEEVEL